MDEFEVIGGRQLYQWDTDRSIEVSLCDGETINEVHYAHAEDDIAPVVKVQDYDGRMFADIPNILLQRFGTLKVWAVVHTEDGRQTLRNAYLSVRARAKPDDYVYTETEIMDYRKVAEDLAERVQRVEEIEENGVQGGGAVASVNGKTGEVYLNAADVGALPTTGGKLTGNLTVPRLISTAADADGNIYEVQLYPTANGGLYMPLRHNGSVANAMSMSQSATTFGKPVAINSGGHGGKNAAEGRQNLSLYSKEEIDEKITNTQKEIERLTEDKVNKQQGAENAEKLLFVGDDGELIHAELGKGIKVEKVPGKNIFHGEWVAGSYNAEGVYAPVATFTGNFAVNEYFPVEPSTTYMFSNTEAAKMGANGYITEYDEDKTFVARHNGVFQTAQVFQKSFTTSANTKYITIFCYA